MYIIYTHEKGKLYIFHICNAGFFIENSFSKIYKENDVKVYMHFVKMEIINKFVLFFNIKRDRNKIIIYFCHFAYKKIYLFLNV